MLIYGINYNILILHLSCLCLYKDVAKKRDLYKDINNFFGMEPNENMTKRWCTFLHQNSIF